MNTNEIILVALNEIQSPRCGTTEQILSVHTLVKDAQGEVMISRVDDLREKDSAYVYLRLKDKIKERIQEYYFVIVIRKSEKNVLEVSASYIEAEVRVYLTINSDILTPEEISSRLQIIPTEIRHKGEPWGKGKYPRDLWYFEPQKNIPETVERKMSFLIEKLTPFELNIANLPNDVYKCINIFYSGYQDWMGGVHFDHSILNKIALLKIEMDIDLYASGRCMEI